MPSSHDQTIAESGPVQRSTAPVPSDALTLPGVVDDTRTIVGSGDEGDDESPRHPEPDPTIVDQPARVPQCDVGVAACATTFLDPALAPSVPTDRLNNDTEITGPDPALAQQNDDGTVVGSIAIDATGEDGTCVGEFSPGPPDDGTVVGSIAVARAGEDGTFVGEFLPGPSDDGTVVGSIAVAAAGEDGTVAGEDLPGPPDDRTVIGTQFIAAGGGDRTVIGESFPDQAPEGFAPDGSCATAGPTGSKGTIASFDSVAGDQPTAARNPELDDESFGTIEHTEAPHGGSPSMPLRDPKRYDLIDNFAHGGLGNIWRARDQRIQRDVAYKELLPAALKNKNFLERFLEEAQITGQLEHPGIVPIYDLGWQDNGTPFYSMKLVRGVTYKKAIEEFHKLPRNSSERHLAFVKRLRNFIDMCNAVAFAHDRGVVHRDLKPQNVMLGDFGETLVLDWGLAKIIGTPERSQEADGDGAHEQATNENPSLSGTASGSVLSGSVLGSSSRQSITSNVRSEGSQTVMGSVMGTPAYMPPEQAKGELQSIEPRSDVYSLGAILYELLTGIQPIAKGKLPEMLQRVVKGDVKPPRSIDPTIPRPLEAVCLKAMSLDRADRYAGALLLARDVERFLADEPIDVYREPWPLRLKRWVKRHRTLVTSTALTVVVLSVACGAWMLTERLRVARIRTRVHAAIEDSRKSNEANDFAQSKLSLNEALGIVRAEPALAESEIDIRERLDQLEGLLTLRERERVEKVRSQAAERIREAQAARDSRQVENAAQLLTAVVTTLKGESKLQDLRKNAEQELAGVQKAIADQNAVKAAQDQFQDFQKNVARARFFASQFTGDRVQNNSQQAQKAALNALNVYGLDRTGKTLPHSAHLSEAQNQEIRADAFELMIVLADAEVSLAADLPAAGKKTAWETAISWLHRARSLGIETQVLPTLESRFFKALGRDAEADKARVAAAAIKPATALEFFLLAEGERKNSQYDAATRLYQQALAIDPQYFLAMYSLGVCNMQRVSAAKGGSNDDNNTNLTGFLTAAVTAFSTCIGQRPDFPWPYILRGVAYSDMGNFDDALADFDHALDTRVNAADVFDPDLYQYGIFLNRGAMLLLQKRFREAEDDFRQAIRLRDSADAHLNLAIALSKQKKNQQAVDELTSAAQLAPNRSVIYKLRAEANKLLGGDNAAFGDYQKAALSDYQRAIESEPLLKATAPLHYEIGRIYHRADKWTEALAAYDRSLALDANNADAHRLRGEVLLKLNRESDAVAAFSKYLELSKPVGDVYRARGLANAKLGQYRAAINDYTRSLELEPSPHMLTRRGWGYLTMAQQLALQDFDEAIKLNPENGDSFNGRGYARVLLGDYAAAVNDAEQAVKLGPKAFEIYYNASTIFAQAVTASGKDPKLAEERRAELAKEYTKRAVELIRLSGEALGPERRGILQKTLEADTALDPIRMAPEFVEFVKEISAQPRGK